MASLEIQLQQSSELRLRAEEDVRIVRDLCMTVEQQKDCITKQLDDAVERKAEVTKEIFIKNLDSFLLFQVFWVIFLLNQNFYYCEF